MRDYTKNPNRFSLLLLYNNVLITSTNRYGSTQSAKRDFDAQFNVPTYLGNNPLNDDVNAKIRSLSGQIKKHYDKSNKFRMRYDEVDSIKYEIEMLESMKTVFNNNRTPHQWERNIFENSWEAVDMGEKLVEVFRLILREGTESYYQDRYMIAKCNEETLNNLTLEKPNGGNNYYTIRIIDNKHPIRDNIGKINNLTEVTNEYDTLLQKSSFGGLTPKETKQMLVLKEQIQNNYKSQKIFECHFSADEYSYDGTDFTPPLTLAWKGFNVDFNTPAKHQKIEYADISEFKSIRDRVSTIRRKVTNMLVELEYAKELNDAFKITAIENELEHLNSNLHHYTNICFKGLRQIIKECFNINEYTNKYLYPETRYNNYNTLSAETELIGG